MWLVRRNICYPLEISQARSVFFHFLPIILSESSADTVEQGIEPGTMVHLHGVAKLMQQHIFNQMLRQQQQVERKVDMLEVQLQLP